jgi:hypothetical protein
MKRIPARPVIESQQRYRQAARVERIHRVAASLRPETLPARQGGPRKQETPSTGTDEVSTDPRQVMADGMAARAKCDRDTR